MSLSAFNSTPGEWASWVDPLLLERLLEGELNVPMHTRAHGVLAFLDIAGFTEITEKLALAGPIGAEQVKELLNATFGLVTHIATSCGGRVLKFPGDAVLVVWLSPDPDQDESVQLALQFSTRAVRDVSQLMVPEGISLTTRSAVVSGAMDVMFVGGTNGHWECLVDGVPVRQLSSLLTSARPGDVIVSDDVQLALRNARDIDTAPLASGYRVTSCRVAQAPAVLGRSSATMLAREIPSSVRLSLPIAVLDHLDAELPDWLGQFRSATAVFARLDHGALPAPRLDCLQRDMTILQTEALRFGGAVHQAVVDDKGTVVVLAWGLSRHAYPDAAVRAVLASLAASASLSERGARASIGVATGRVFAGVRGGIERREYAMVGSVVNRAARLMQASTAWILCDEATRNAAGGRIEFEPVGLRDRGDAVRQIAYRPLAEKANHAANDKDPIGRTSELSALLEALQQVAAGIGRTVIVEGEPGIGKSCLIGSVVRRAAVSGLRTVIVRGDPIERSQYDPWRAPLARLLGVAGLAVDKQQARLESLLGDDPIGVHLSLLNAVLPISLDDSEITRELTPQGRATTTRELLLRLVTTALGEVPALLVFEDAHWYDVASWALAEGLMRRGGPTLCIVALRSTPSAAADAMAAIMTADHAVTRLSLGPLSANDIRELLQLRLAVESLPSSLNALAWEKARGHPFYTEQIVLALCEAQLLQVDGGVCTIRGDISAALSRSLPDTVEGVVASRIDGLSAPQQILLKVASVIGSEFDVAMLRLVSPSTIPILDLQSHLDAMVNVGLLSRDPQGRAEVYVFAHAITLQVTYELLPFALRRSLHRTIAQQLEERGAATHAHLAHHWERAEIPGNAFRHLIAAGEAAVRNNSSQEASAFFRQALSLDASKLDLPTDAAAFQRARCHRMLAETLWILGAFASVPGEVASSFRLLGGRERWTRGRYALLATQFGLQIVHLTAGAAVRRGRHRRDELLELSRGASVLAMLRASPCDAVALIASSLLTLNLAEAAGSTNVLALGLLGYAADAVGFRRLADTYFGRAREMAPRLGQLDTFGLTLLFECMSRFAAGDHQKAVGLLHEGLELGQRIGDRSAIARASDMLSTLHSFSFIETATTSMKYVTDAIDFIRDRPVADRIFFLETLRAVSAQLLRPADARTIFEPFESMVEPSLQHCGEDAAALMHASNALFHTRQGDIASAVRAADAAFAWGASRLRELPATGWVFFEGPLEAYLAAAELASAEGNRNRDARLRVAARAVAMLRGYARRRPIYRPRALHFAARLSMAGGRTQHAREMWEGSRAQAVRLGLVLDQARAHLHLSALAAGAVARREHLRTARSLLEPVGSGYFMDLLEQEERR